MRSTVSYYLIIKTLVSRPYDLHFFHKYTMTTVDLDGFTFKKSTRKGKKYDVFDAETGDYITSFGSRIHEHYFDRIGLYSHLNHGDEKRRKNYRSRHRNDHIDDPTKAGYFAWHYLW